MRFLSLLFLTALLSLSQPTIIITITPGEDVTAIVNAAPIGSTLRIQAGRYFVSSPLRPKANTTIEGATGNAGDVVIYGSRLLGNWKRWESPVRYEVASQAQQGERYVNAQWTVCDAAFPRCTYPDDVFMTRDGVTTPLRHVATLAELSDGEFFFNYDLNTIAVGSDPTGATMTAAISPFALQTNAAGVIVRNITFEQFSTPTQRAALEFGTQATIDGVTIQYSHAAGITVGSGSVVRNSRLLENGQAGAGASGLNALFEGNEIAFNNYAGHSRAFAAGGFSKAANSTGLMIRSNYVHHNLGDGIWADVRNTDLTIADNRVEFNRGHGIFHEIGYTARITGNVVLCNDKFAVILMSSLGTADNPILVSDNTITVCEAGDAIAIRRDGDRPDRLMDYVVVTRNSVQFRNGRGRVLIDGWNGYAPGNNIVFAGNAYFVQSSLTYHWTLNGANQLWTAWSAKYPDDLRFYGEPFPLPTLTHTPTLTPSATVTATLDPSTNEPTLTPSLTPTTTETGPTLEATKTPTAQWVQIGVYRLTIIVERQE